MYIFLMQQRFELCDVDLIIFFFDKLEQLLDTFSHLCHLGLRKFQMQRLIDAKAFVLEFIHNHFFSDRTSWNILFDVGHLK